MERLTKHGIFPKESVMFIDSENNYMPLVPCEMKAHHTQLVLEKLADYEDKQEQGLLIELPVPLGETVYRLVPKTYRRIETITISEYLVRGNMLYYKSKKSGLLYPCSEIGKTVFLTRSEAEEALAKMKKED